MDSILILCMLCGSFFCGAIPTGYLLVKHWEHLDIREIGSGNIGSTNVGRAAGPRLAIPTQILDILKGLVPVAVALIVAHYRQLGVDTHVLVSLTALAAIAGHDFTPFLRFRGGKGINTTLGAFLLLAPVPVLGGVCVFYLLRILTRIVSIRALALGITIPVFAALFHLPFSVVLASLVAAGLIVLRHVQNIKRLVKGSELR